MMAKVFYPLESELVPASQPHPKNTFYKVSVGIEDWTDTNGWVYKVQMVYDGKVSGRRAPSFPVNTDDFERVTEAMGNLQRRLPQVVERAGGQVQP